MNLRIENFRHGEWMLRGEGEIPAGTTLETVKAQVDRLALNHAARAFLNGKLVYVRAKLTPKAAKEVFGL